MTTFSVAKSSYSRSSTIVVILASSSLWSSTNPGREEILEWVRDRRASWGRKEKKRKEGGKRRRNKSSVPGVQTAINEAQSVPTLQNFE
jgi:hypothetical protein